MGLHLLHNTSYIYYDHSCMLVLKKGHHCLVGKQSWLSSLDLATETRERNGLFNMDALAHRRSGCSSLGQVYMQFDNVFSVECLWILSIDPLIVLGGVPEPLEMI